jgi:hypothetical protein
MQRPHVTGDALSALIGVPKSMLANKAQLIRDILRISQMRPEFCRGPSRSLWVRPGHIPVTGRDAARFAARSPDSRARARGHGSASGLPARQAGPNSSTSAPPRATRRCSWRSRVL